jgi:hypothetical protein
MKGDVYLHPLYSKMAWTEISLSFYLYQSGFAKELRNGIEILNSIQKKVKSMK